MGLLKVTGVQIGIGPHRATIDIASCQPHVSHAKVVSLSQNTSNIIHTCRRTISSRECQGAIRDGGTLPNKTTRRRVIAIKESRINQATASEPVITLILSFSLLNQENHYS